MTRLNTEQLVEKLASDGSPVRRLAPPLLRATIWLAGFAVVATAAVWLLGAIPGMAGRLSDPRFALEMVGTLLTGLFAVGAAFCLSLPDRSRLWLLVPLPPLMLWLSMSGYGCYRDLLTHGAGGWAQGASPMCFAFIVGFGIPTALALYFPLRRASPLNPIPALASAGLGVAALSAAMLQFFHPIDVTVLDLVTHVFAVLTVVMLTIAIGRPGMRGAAG